MNEEYDEELSSNPSDYYFKMNLNTSDGDYFTITPKAVWDNEGCLSDQHFPPAFNKLLGLNDFSCEMESCYSYHRNSAHGRLILLRLGLVENNNMP